MPGPMAACARSTGAMLPRCRCASATGSSALSAVTNSRRVAVGASAARGRQTRTMLEARALVPMPIIALARSVRIGQVPLMRKAGADHRIEEGLPAGAGGTVVARRSRTA